MKLLVIRHGLTELNMQGRVNGQIADDPLSQKGVAQTEELEHLLPPHIDIIYASDFLRTRQTAEIINTLYKTALYFDPDLREVNFGSLAGKTWEEMDIVTGIKTRERYRLQTYDFGPWGGESFEQVKARLTRCVDKIKSQNDGQLILIVTHGGIIRTLHFLYKKELLDNINNLSLYQFEI